MPQVQTQYFSAAPKPAVEPQTLTNLNQFAGGDTDALRGYAGGQQESQNWNAYPLHPAPDTTLGGPTAAFPVQASAARSGNRLNLGFTPFSDNQFGHLGPGFFGNGNAAGHRQLRDRPERPPDRPRERPERHPGHQAQRQAVGLKFTLNAHRYSSFFRLSSGSQTVWTWRSARDTAARVPRAWYCTIAATQTSFRLVRQCAVQHLMTLSYQVQGMGLTGLTRPGPQVVNVTAGHIQLGGSARRSPGPRAQVSFNDGDTWFPAKVDRPGRRPVHGSPTTRRPAST